jgi:hypothetical protein
MSLPSQLSDFSGSTGGSQGSSPLNGRMLCARVGWVALTLVILGLNLAMIPQYYETLRGPCPAGPSSVCLQLSTYDQELLRQMHLSLGFLAGYQAMLDIVSVLVCCGLGALIFARKSTDRMALFCAFMLVLFSGAGFTSILQDTIAQASTTGFLLIGILSVLGHVSFSLFFFLFPSGRFVPDWSRWAALGVIVYWIYSTFFADDQNSSGIAPDNLILFALLLCVVGVQVYRFRRVSTPRERQQTKWVVYGFAVGITAFVLLIILGSAFLPPTVLDSSVITTLVLDTSIYCFLLLIPVSIAIAVLRSQLWDIDTIINQTLVYVSLTGLLGALYAGLILGLEGLIGSMTGATNLPVVLVVSTLVIARLILPVRSRLQATIDHRFYRRKYDAERVLNTFTGALRSEIDLEQLRTQLLGIVNETIQPVTASLWLSPRERQPDKGARRPEPSVRAPSQPDSK